MDISLCLQALQLPSNTDFSKFNATVIGLGGTGSRVAELLVRHNINVRLIDKERVYEKEMIRQTLFGPEDIGKFKAKQAKKILERINPDVKIKTFHEELTQENSFLLQGDIIIDTTNSHDIALLTNRAAVTLQTAFISSNVAGVKATMLTLIPGQEGGCARCAGEKHNVGSIKAQGLFSPLSELMAGLVSSQALHILTNKEANNQLISVNMEPYSITTEKIEKQKGCPLCDQ